MLRTSTRRFSLGASRAAFALAIAVGFAAGLAPPPSSARAQVDDAQPHWVAVAADDVYLRCGDGVVWYPVMKVDAGQLLRVDGKGFKWLRVAYPKGAPAFIRAEEADLTPDGQAVVATRPTRLLAANLHSGLDGSWKALLAAPLPPGERLTVLGVVRSGAGEVQAYRVQTPSIARAYISEEFVRPATDEEIMAALNRAATAEDESEQAPDALAQAPAQSPAQPGDAPPAPAETIAPSPATPLSLHEVLERYGGAGASEADALGADAGKTESKEALAPPQRQTPTPRPESAKPSTPTPASTSSGAPALSSPPPPARSASVDRRALPTIAQLDAAFTSVMAEPVAAAEIDPLIREHERLINSLLGKPHTQGQVAYLRRQAQLLNIKADFQQSMRRLEEAAERAAIAAASIDQRIEALDAQRIYPHVGRLVASAIYDGERLPLMFRLQTGNPSAPTTLAYVLPSDEMDLRAMLGAIVGLQGHISRDDSLGVPIIRPARAEILVRPSEQASVPDDER